MAKSKAEQQAEWMTAFEEHVVKAVPSLVGTVDWNAATYYFGLGKTAEEAASAHVAAMTPKAPESDDRFDPKTYTMDKGTQTGRTPAPITVHAKRIFEIAKLLNPVYEQVDTAFQNLFGPDMDGEKLMREWAEACYQYNRVAGGFLREIAILTGNNPETLEQVFRPRDAYSTFPTPTFIANVARYESFNDKLWTKYSGMEREPTNDFGPL